MPTFPIGEVAAPSDPLGSVEFVTNPFRLLDIPRRAHVYGLLIRPTIEVGGGTARVTAELVTEADLATVLATLAGTLGRSWTDDLSDAGAGELQIPNDDADAAAFAINGRQLVNFSVDGQVAWTMRVEQRELTQVASSDNDAELLTKWSGRGHLSVVDEAVVYPALGVDNQPVEDDRTFDWTAFGFDDSHWATAKVVDFYLFASLGLLGSPPNWPIPWNVTFPDMEAGIMWDASGTTTAAPIGNVYARDFVIITQPGRYIVFLQADNYAELYIDGVLISTATDFGNGTPRFQAEVNLSYGVHLLAFLGVNAGGPAGFAAAIYLPGYPPTLVYHTGGFNSLFGNTMKILGYPPNPPGLTVGAVMRIVLAEAHTRGRLLGVSLGFTDVVDSSGQAWEYAAISTKVGTDYYTFFKEISNTYADIAMRPGTLIIDAWNLGTKGVPHSTLDLLRPPDESNPNSGNLTSLVRKGERAGATALLIRWQGGWHPIGGGDTEALLTLGALLDVSQVDVVGGQQLALYRNPRELVEAAYDSRSILEQPYAGFLTGDSVSTINEDGATFTLQRVHRIAVSEDPETGDVLFALGLHDRVLEIQERVLQWIKKMTNGTLGGRSHPAQPVVSQPPKIRGLALAFAGPTCFAESFNDVDGASIGPDLTWDFAGGSNDGLDILSNQLALNTAPTFGYFVGPTNLNGAYDGTVGIAVTATSAGMNSSSALFIGGPPPLASSTSLGISFLIMFAKLAGGAGWRLCYANADDFQVLDSGPTTGTNWRLEWTSGGRLRCYIDGVLISDHAFAETGFSGQLPGNAGLMMDSFTDPSYTSGTTGPIWDDFEVCSLGAS